MEKSISSHKSIAAVIAGYENLAVWADLLDRINVFPVADGDTGVNLRVSLAPLRECCADMAIVVARLACNGRGNSGNIAVAFFCEFLNPKSGGLVSQVKRGRDKAWQAIADPRPGTMLAVFDCLSLLLNDENWNDLDYLKIRKQLQDAVLATRQQLPELSAAGVVDSGALGMFLFFDGFFREISGQKTDVSSVPDLFGDTLCIDSSYQPQASGEFCVEALLAVDGSQEDLSRRIAALGNSAVVVPDDCGVKLHIHTRDPEQLRNKLSLLGDVVNWSDEAMDPMIAAGEQKLFPQNSIRIMSDAAGSIPLEIARGHGLILLDSYILAQDQALPESLFSSEQLYVLMKAGARVSTAQASTHERHLHYDAAVQQYEKVLYLSTGSAFTGNFATAGEWKTNHDLSDQFTVLDTGAASGRLAVIALLTARLAGEGASADVVIDYAEKLIREAEEYVFIHELKYLVAGGRVSRVKGFFGDLLHMKPVISPGFDGVRKVSVVRDRAAQMDFARGRLRESDHQGSALLVLLQYTDNKEWLVNVVEPQIHKQVPEAEILLVPLSLTSGVHMGPGTWSIAFAATEGPEC